MSICKYCGHETGSKMFCEYCGAKTDKVEVAPQPPMPPMPQPPVPQPAMQDPQFQPSAYQQPVRQDPRFQSGVYQQPVLNQMPMQNPYFRPRKAGAYLAANIIVLVLSCIFFCGLFPLVSIPLSIIGIVFSVKAGNSKSAQEENACRLVAMIMMIIGILFLVLGIVVFCGVVYDKYGSFGAFWDDMMNG